MTPQSAQRAVARALHHEKVLVKRPWLVQKPRVRYAMISIRYKIHGDFGCLIFHTWAIGLTVKAAVRSWRTTHPGVIDDDFDYTVVTEPKKPDHYQTQGERVEPPDPFLASL